MELIKKYKLLEKIREDKISSLYLAYHTEYKKIVLVRLLDIAYLKEKKLLSSLKEFLEKIQRISHPNLANIFDFSEEKDFFLIAEENVEGKTLEEKIKSQVISPESALNIAWQIAEFLRLTEKEGIVLANLFPKNIYLTDERNIKIIEPGLVQNLVSQPSDYNTLDVSYVYYSAPEQIIQGKIWRNSIIYSLGVILYEMLTGVNPFSGKDTSEVALNYIKEEKLFSSEKLSGISKNFQELINKCLSKDPSLRYNSIDELLKEIKAVQNEFKKPEQKIIEEDLEEELKIILPLQNGKKKRGVFTLLSVFIIIVFFACLGFIYSYFFLTEVKEIIVPDLLGKDFKEAKEILEKNKLQVNILKEEFSKEIPKDQVISQFPLPGRKIKENRFVHLTLSKGFEVTVVPEVRNLSFREAKLLLEKNRLIIGKINKITHELIPKDYIVEQNPLAQTEVSVGEKINLIVSTGPEKVKVKMPDLIGKTLEEARQLIIENGLKLTNIKRVVKEDVPEEQVIEQNPPAETEVVEDSSVSLTVSATKPKKPTPDTSSETKQASINIEVPEGASQQEIRVVVIDDDGLKEVYKKIHSPKDKIELNVTGLGSVTIQVYIDGELIKEENL